MQVYGANLKSLTSELLSGLDVSVLLEQSQDHWKPLTFFDFHFVFIVVVNNISERVDGRPLELLALFLHERQQLRDALKIMYLSTGNMAI